MVREVCAASFVLCEVTGCFGFVCTLLRFWVFCGVVCVFVCFCCLFGFSDGLCVFFLLLFLFFLCYGMLSYGPLRDESFFALFCRVCVGVL